MSDRPRAAAGEPAWTGWAWYTVAALLFVSFAYTEMAGSDLWWHIAGGREIIDQGSPWLRDQWSYTAAGERWHNHEWLADLGFHAWQALFGLPSLVYWKILLVVSAYSVLFAALWRLSEHAGSALLLAALAIAVAEPFIDMRPQLYSFLGFTALVWLYLRNAPLWQWALLFLLWANLHGGFVLGLLMLPLLVFPYSACTRANLVRAVLRFGACAAASLCNPDGAQVLALPLVYALQGDSPFRQLGEWLPPWVAGGIRSPLFFWTLPAVPLALLAYCLPAWRRRYPFPWWALGLCLLTLAMALTSRRFIPFYAMSLALFLAPLAGHLLRGHLRPSLHMAIGLCLGVTALLRLIPLPLQAAPAFHYLTAQYSYPRDTVDVMLAHDLAGPVFAYYNWGGYLHLRSDGRLRVFIDGRANTLFSDATYLDYLRVLRARPGWIAVIEESGAQFFLWPNRRAGGARRAQALIATGRWALLYQGGEGYVLGRTDAATDAARQALANAPLALAQPGPLHRLSAARRALWRGDSAAALALAGGVRRALPWERNACMTQARALQEEGRKTEAAAVIAECRRWFPSRYLSVP